MIPITLNGEPVYLLHYRADWQAGFDLSLVMPADIDRSQGGIEARAPLGETLRARVGFELQLFEDESAAFRVALQKLGDKRVLCPLWAAAHRYIGSAAVYLDENGEAYLDEEGNPYVGEGITTPYIGSAVWLFFQPDWSAWEVVQGSEGVPGFTTDAETIRVPLLLGRFEEPPRPKAVTDRLLTCSIRFAEQSPASQALLPMFMTAPQGPSIGGRELLAFPLDPDWSVEPEIGEVVVDREELPVGLGREPATSCFPQDSSRVVTLGYTPWRWIEVAKLVSFFLQQRGQAGHFWLPCPAADCYLTAAASATDTLLHVDDPSLLGDNQYLAFQLAGGLPVYARIYSVDTVGRTVTLAAPLGMFLPAGQVVGTAVLARFSSPELAMHFSTDSLAEARLSFLELGSEYYTPAGEVVGTTMGGLLPEVHLYRFTRAYPGQQIVNRYTSHERDLLLDGQLYLARPIEHDKTVDTIAIDDAVSTVRAAHFAGSPLALVPGGRLEAPLYCEIIEAELNAEGLVVNPISRAYGRVTKPRVDGTMVEVKVGSLLSGLDAAFPAMLLTPNCNVGLFTPPCGVSEAAHTYTGTLVSVVSGTVTLESLSRVAGGGLPTLFDGYFSYGRLCTGSGETFESRTIYSSAIVASGRMAFVLSHPLNLSVTGPVYVTPGCSGSFQECHLKFNNRPNFRGFPYMPASNPSLGSAGGDQESGSKK